MSNPSDFNDWKLIQDGGRLRYLPGFLNQIEAEHLFRELQSTIAWRQEKIFGKPAPRLNAWFSDARLEYRYSGISHVGAGWPHSLLAIKQRVEQGSSTTFNSVLLNRYRDGRDSISYHADDEPELGVNPVVATLSLGAEREFRLKHCETRTTLRFHLKNGSLLVMAGATQRFWRHGVPKCAEAVGERISLTFRLLFARGSTTRSRRN